MTNKVTNRVITSLTIINLGYLYLYSNGYLNDNFYISILLQFIIPLSLAIYLLINSKKGFSFNFYRIIIYFTLDSILIKL